MAALALIPRGPVLDWSACSGRGHADLPAVDGVANRILATSGRAALYLALRALALRPGTAVLVPTYHCPTMIAPVLHAGLEPLFYGIGGDGLPRLDGLAAPRASGAGAMIVAHYFGRPRSLARERAWCDEHQIALIEDCAHCFFGQAGERPVGHWGDYAIASLTKFFPVPEAGMLVSSRRPLPLPRLGAQGSRAQIKGVVDLLEQAERAGRLGGLRQLLGSVFRLKNRRAAPAATQHPASPSSAQPAFDALQGCDMSRAEMAALVVARLVFNRLPRERIVQRRRMHHERLRQSLQGAPGAHVLFDEVATGAPYALALWVDDADRVYQALRSRGMPVFRWDQFWRGMPRIDDDHGPLWGRHVLQLLCHQDLHTGEVSALADALLELLSA